MGYYIPAYTADVHPSFASFYGLRGDGKRAELAREFKIPTTWKMYCELFPLDCATGERVAKRYPNGTDEENSYFVRNLYDGHFRLPDNIETCEQDGDCIAEQSLNEEDLRAVCSEGIVRWCNCITHRHLEGIR